MRNWLLLLLVAVIAVPVTVSAGVWPLGRDMTYNLGTDPTPGGLQKMEDHLGFIGIEAYDKENSALTLKIHADTVKLEADADVNSRACAVREPVTLKPSEFCAFWGKDETKKREYHLRISWSYEDKKGVRVVVLRVKKTTLKLAN